MSAIGTSYAAGVAQTAHAAQQVARQRDKARTDRAGDQADFARLVAERLDAPEDAADPDAELPDRQAPGYEQLYPLPEGETPAPSPDPETDAPVTPVADFQHIDVQA